MASLSISYLVWAGKNCLGPNGELCYALIPALDDLAYAQGKFESLSSFNAGVEDLTVSELSCVMDFYLSSLLREFAIAFLKHFYFQPIRKALNFFSITLWILSNYRD